MVFFFCCRRIVKGRGCFVLDIILVVVVIMVGVMFVDIIGIVVIVLDIVIGWKMVVFIVVDILLLDCFDERFDKG